MQFESVRAVAERMKSRFKIEMDLHEVNAACADALRKMKALSLERKIIVARVNNFQVHVPGVWKVRGVVRLESIPPDFHIELQDIWFPPQIVFTQPEEEVQQQTIMLKDNVVGRLKGPWEPYSWQQPYCRFNETDILVGIEVTTLAFDEEGFVKILEPAFFACLYYTLYAYYEPLFLLGQVPDKVWDEVTKWKNDNVRQGYTGLVMNALNSKEMDELFDIAVSMDRKKFGVPS